MVCLVSGCDPLTPEDIAEVIVFAASRKQNVVIADTLVFPNHQVSTRPLPPTHASPVAWHNSNTHTRGPGRRGCLASALELKGGWRARSVERGGHGTAGPGVAPGPLACS